MTLYRVIRFFKDGSPLQVIADNLTQEQIDEYCQNAEPQTVVDPEWTDGYEAIYDQNSNP